MIFNTKLSDRIESYHNSTEYTLLPNIPLVISVNGRKFGKVTSLLEKPYSEKFAECMVSTMLKLSSEIEGIIFGYQFNDQIILISKNSSGWYKNNIQSICSATSSIATNHFSNTSSNLNLIGDGIFITNIFPVPNNEEIINTIIYYQQQNFFISVQSACFYELLKFNDKNKIKEILFNMTYDEKIYLLKEKCSIDYHKYELSFLNGIACYRVPKLVDNIIKNKWIINTNLPIFSKEKSFFDKIL